jgi:hypothetical protein
MSDLEALMPTKSIFASVTFWGAVVTAFSLLFPHLYTTLGLPPDASVVATHIVGGIGTAITIYGRFHATQAVTLTGK